MPRVKSETDDELWELWLKHGSQAEMCRQTGLTAGQMSRRMKVIFASHGKVAAKKAKPKPAVIVVTDHSPQGVRDRMRAAGVPEAGDDDDDVVSMWDTREAAEQNYRRMCEIRDDTGLVSKADRLAAGRAVQACLRFAMMVKEAMLGVDRMRAFEEAVLNECDSETKARIKQRLADIESREISA